jgi:hypothetical protein
VSRAIDANGISFRIEGTAAQAIAQTDLGVNAALNLIALAWQGRSIRYLSENIYNQPIPLGRDGKRQWLRTNRLRSSVAWAVPDKAYTHTKAFTGGTVSYPVPKSERHSIVLGSNVEYAPVIHEGLSNATQSVRAHTRTQSHVFGRKVAPFKVNVGPFTRTVNRRAVPFISQPGYDLLPQIPRIITGELRE